jgi:cytochrome c553
MKIINYMISAWMLSGLCYAPSTLSADAAAGAQKAAACASCHGENGISRTAQIPNLAGQSADYLANQLKAFKSGQRSNPMMQNMANNLSDEDASNLAAHFAGLSAQSAGGDAQLASAGQSKAAMCLGCHGTEGKGRGPIPRLAGQHPGYLQAQLQNFKAGDRKNSPMQAIANNLADDDMKVLAAYFGSLK